ncbi:hypothetical protein NDU88_001818 [Pleurodeles waltl]|uniref:Uncharacterized protein n=1 Tax=Pleurodeles waltl TaxID=8319 RepID=A0AAV7VYR4_PLEWA|nr:hypothetical protein NDU88_001818 [Pleurodeles waltl]
MPGPPTAAGAFRADRVIVSSCCGSGTSLDPLKRASQHLSRRLTVKKPAGEVQKQSVYASRSNAEGVLRKSV